MQDKKQKDWSGNGFTNVCLGVHNYSDHKREENDFYATDPRAIIRLLEVENLHNVWECACGQGHLAKVLKERNLLGRASDLIDRGYGEKCIDFLLEEKKWNGDIVTNPPFKFAKEFILKGLSLLQEDGNKVIMFLRVQFLESKGRYNLFTQTPLKKIYVFSGRIGCYLNGKNEHSQSAVPYAWYIWEKGYKEKPTIDWILL